MNETLTEVCKALEGLGDHVLASWSDDRPLTEALGWFAPAITRQALSSIPKRLAVKIRQVGPDALEENIEKALKLVPARLELTKAHTVPQMFNGNAGQAVPAYLATIDWVRLLLDPVLSWESIKDPKLLPPGLARRVASYTARLNKIEGGTEGLEEKIKRINDAHDAAESLPTDMEALVEARQEIKKLAAHAEELRNEISAWNIESATLLKSLRAREDEAGKVVGKCEEAYRVTTSKGLAGAFDERAGNLRMSMRLWVAGLMLSLVLGAILGSQRIAMLSDALTSQDPHWGAILIQLVLSILSVGGPLWFAWLATKQVGQRFRLAEDYAFKASVAKAYEGFRKEAVRIDEVFEARLFSSALTRLEEAPLRLVEGTSHGSPWHEFLSSPAFKEATEIVPNFKESITEIFKKGMDTVEGVAKKSSGDAKAAVEDAAKGA